MSVYVGESRGELLQWLNELLAPQVISKLEECGKGYIYCQVVDSIFGDLPMHRVKLNARMEYEYLENFKILQKAFNTHRIDKPIPVDRLVKCKMQDNLEFMQWMKKFWDANSRGEGYDAQARANQPLPVSAPSSSRAAPAAARTATRTPLSGAGAGSRSASSASNVAVVNELRGQVAEMQTTCESLEKERDFYFDKLRNIELIVQERSNIEGLEQGEKDVIAKIQEILYSTTEGFELPENGEAGEEEELPQEEETF